MMIQNEQQVISTIHGVLDSLNMRLYDIHFNHVAKMIRIFIDRESGSITIADCKKANQLIMSVLDQTEGIRASYSLEVSSPGIERSLKRPEHFAWAVGKTIYVYTGKDKIKGYLRDTHPDGIVVATQDGEQFIRFNAIVKANVVEDLVYDKRR
jgi:ribosome maturation factor RimP